MDIPGQTGSVAMPPTPRRPALKDRRGRVYEPAIGPRLKVYLAVIFAGVALLGATGIYLFALSALNFTTGRNYTSYFSLCMVFVHTYGGVLFVLPFIIFGLVHYATARHRPNRRAVRLGIALFSAGIIVCVTGLALVQVHDSLQLPTKTLGRWIVYALHVIAPLAAVYLYVLHRRAGPDLKWQWGAAWGVSVVAFIGIIGAMHAVNPNDWNRVGSPEGEKYFEPSASRTIDSNFIAADTLMMDSYCIKCHKDVYNDWFHSAHHFSSFNNPPYLFAVRETRKVALARDGNMKAARWCAGCHDVVPFFSGKFDDPNYDDVNDPTAQAGITCTSCHAITNVNSTKGNGDYTIAEPLHYPFAKSENAILQYLNNQMIKAKPDFHKQTFLKPFHKTAEFCSTCHKVSLPMELNHYKDFLRGQNHHDTFYLSGVSGHNARSFYYPKVAKTNCAECHMPLRESKDFGASDFDDSGTRQGHGHNFPGANTGLPWILSLDPAKKDHLDEFVQAAEAQAKFLKDKKVRIDLFGLREGGNIDDKLHAPLRPEMPKVRPGQSYLVEVVVRTLDIGHPFSQGTVDSNEIWVDFEARSGDRVIGRNGAMSGPNDSGKVDENAHFINVLMLDRNGNRINRRNPQDIFTPLYNHQIPPGAANVIHYRLDVPKDVSGPIQLKARVRYRKFDFEYMSLVNGGDDKVPKLPVVDMCSDSVTLRVDGFDKVDEQKSPIEPAWQRWNDYGIGLFLIASGDAKRPGLRQAEEAFQKLAGMEAPDPQAHGNVNLARSYVLEGDLSRAESVLKKIQDGHLPSPWWTVSWFTGLVNAQNGHLDEAIADFEKILDPANQPRERKFDFSTDYVVLNELGKTYFNRAQQELNDRQEQDRFLRKALIPLERTLSLDQEDLEAHYWLRQCFAVLGHEEEPRQAQASDSDKVQRSEIEELGSLLTDTNSSREQRAQAGFQLAKKLVGFGEQPPDPQVHRLLALQNLIVRVTKSFETEKDPLVIEATAQVLASLHGAMHGLLIEDANAKNQTVEKYRSGHKAADRASQAIVIYPTAK
ncbi:MAG: multiheme c-type cytochrome [Gemmataceae bacterium]